jgi:N-acyl-D-amino-acid deacylase
MKAARVIYSGIVATAMIAALANIAPQAAQAPAYDILIKGGTIYDGTGTAPFTGDVGIVGDRIAYVGPHMAGTAKRTIDAAGKAVSPGFINMLSWATDSLIVDGTGQSDLRQGVTLEVMGEGTSMGPLTEKMKQLAEQRQTDIKYKIDWTTLGQYLEKLQAKGISLNVASFIGAATARMHELGEDDVQPTPEQLVRMQALVRESMEEGALGVGSALIYAPGSYAKTPELTALVKEAGACGGTYISHMRSEGNHVDEAVDELISISRKAKTPAEIYHLKVAGQPNWQKLPSVLDKIDAARAGGSRITANMYVYEAGATGLDAAMPTWVQSGGLEAWVARLKDPATRKRVLAEMRDPHAPWENLYRLAGAEGTLFLGFKSDKLKPLTGKRLSEVAKLRGESPEDTIIDLVIEDNSRVEVAYFLMSEDNIAKEVVLPYVSFGSDESAQEPEGVFLKSSAHPRAYGNVARLLGHYVRDQKLISLQEAVRKLTSLPAGNLSLHERGILKKGYFADVVVFDPKTIQDHATYVKPQQYATGVSEVIVNGIESIKDGKPTGAHSGRVIRGRAWKGWPDGGCRKSPADWAWTKS